MKKFSFFIFLCLFMFNQNARADEYADLIAYRDALVEQIAAVDSEIERCEKTLKGWKAATIIGGVGAVASGVGILLQNKQIKENEKALHDIKEVEKLTKELSGEK